MARIIGITGLAGAGKDTCAQAMRAAYTEMGVAAALEGYADPIRKIAYVMGLNPYDRKTKERPLMFRVDHFCDVFQHGIDVVLAGRVSKDERLRLYAYTMMALSEVHGHIVISPRGFMQILGTEGGQRVRRTFWVDLAAERWDRMPGYVLVTDFRFMHELPPLDEVVCVIRKGTKRVNDHVSEDLADMLTQQQPRYLEGQQVFYIHNDRTQRKFEKRSARYAEQTHKTRNPE
jgi:hypothetical protein